MSNDPQPIAALIDEKIGAIQALDDSILMETVGVAMAFSTPFAIPPPIRRGSKSFGDDDAVSGELVTGKMEYPLPP